MQSNLSSSSSDEDVTLAITRSRATRGSGAPSAAGSSAAAPPGTSGKSL